MARIGGSWRIPAVSKAAPASMVSEHSHAAAHGEDLGREFRSCVGVDFQDQDLFYTANWRSNLRYDGRIGCGLRWRPNQWDPGEDDVQQMKSSSSFSVRGDRRSGGGNLVDYHFPADEEWRARLRVDEEEWRARCRADDERWRAHVQASDERWESLLRAFKERLNSRMPTVRSNFQGISIDQDSSSTFYSAPIYDLDDEVEEESLVEDDWSEEGNEDVKIVVVKGALGSEYDNAHVGLHQWDLGDEDNPYSNWNPKLQIDELEGRANLLEETMFKTQEVGSRSCGNLEREASIQGNDRKNDGCQVFAEMPQRHNFASRNDTIFCGVFDGHGPFSHMVARKVRDSLPVKLCTHGTGNVSGNNTLHENGFDPGSRNSEAKATSFDNEWGESMDIDLNGKPPEMVMIFDPGGNGNWNEIVEYMMIAEGVRRNVRPHLQLHDPTLEVESQGQRRNEKDWKIDDDLPGECQILEKEVNSEKLHETKAQQISKMSSTSVKRLHADTKLNEELQVEVARMKRNEEVMMKFSKALWSVLKQYKNMLEEESKDEVKNLKENLGEEINQVAKLKNELKELKFSCLCYKHPFSEGNLKPKVDIPFGHSASAQQITSSDLVDLKITDAELTSDLTPMPSCQNLEISSLEENECEVLGLKGILFDGKTDVKSSFCSLVERHSFIVERQKISAYDAVHSSVTCGDSEIQYNKLETSSASGPSSIIEDFNGPRDENILQECKSFIEQGHSSEILVEMESLRDMEMSCGGGMNCITGIEHSDNLTRSDLVEDSTSILSLSDMCSTLPVEKGEASDTACSILSVEDKTNQNNEKEGSSQEFKHKPEDEEEIKDGHKESSHNESLTGRHLYPEVHPSNSHDVEEDERGIIHTRESNLEERKPVLDVPLVEDIKENDCCKVWEHLKNGNHVSSNKSSTAEKPKRRLLPASALLLKEFSGLDMEAESTKERRKLPAVERTQGSVSLVRLLTDKQ